MREEIERAMEQAMGNKKVRSTLRSALRQSEKEDIPPDSKFFSCQEIRRSNSKRLATLHRSNPGFTLLEVMFALAIFGITLVSSIAAVSQMHLLQESGRALSIASLHAQKILEEIKLQADTSIDTAENINWTTWAASNGCNTLQNETSNVMFTSVTSNLTEVNVNVNWSTKAHPMTYQVVTRLAS